MLHSHVTMHTSDGSYPFLYILYTTFDEHFHMYYYDAWG